MTQKTKILIYDDSPELLEALHTFLEREEFAVTTAVSNLSFQQALKTSEPDIILIDVYLKENVDGREVCKQIKTQQATMHIPVLLMSASYNNLENYRAYLADAIIEKPFNLSDLITQINILGANQHATNV